MRNKTKATQWPPRSKIYKSVIHRPYEDPFLACKGIFDALLISSEGELAVPARTDKRLKLLPYNPYWKLLVKEDQEKMLLAYPWISRWLKPISTPDIVTLEEAIEKKEDQGILRYDDPEVTERYFS